MFDLFIGSTLTTKPLLPDKYNHQLFCPQTEKHNFNIPRLDGGTIAYAVRTAACTYTLCIFPTLKRP